MTRVDEPDLGPPYRDVYAAAIMPFLYRPDLDVQELEKCNETETFKREAADWVPQFVGARNNVYKAQPAWRSGVVQFNVEAPLEEFDLFASREEGQFLVEEPHFHAVFSLFPRTGVGTVAFWLKVGDVQARDALQAVDLFKFTEPPAANCRLRLRGNPKEFRQVSELARTYLEEFKREYPDLFPEPPAEQLTGKADEPDPSFSYPFLYVSSVTGTKCAADLLNLKGKEIVSLNNRYRLFDQTIGDFEVERAFKANLLQYDYGVILVSRASAVEIHAKVPFSGPEPGKSMESLILDDLFQLMLLAEVPVMQVFSLQHVNLMLEADLDSVQKELRPRIWIFLLMVSLISLAALGISIYAPRVPWPRKHGEWLASVVFWLCILGFAHRFTDQVRQNLRKKRSFMNLISRFGTVWVSGEVIYGRFNDAYQSAFPIAQLTKSYEQKQSTLDSLLDSGFRLFVGIVAPLIALFSALFRNVP